MFLIFVLSCFVFWWLVKPCIRPKNFPPGPINFPLIGGIPYFALHGGLFGALKWMTKKYGKAFSFNLGTDKVMIVTDYHLYKELANMEEVSYRPSK